MALKIAKRGRPSKAELAARAKAARKPKRTDARILKDLKERFDILDTLTHGAISDNVRAVVVSGAPGVGKSYTVERILENSPNKHTIVRGTISAINLYMLAYQYRNPGDVIVLDDADDVFNDEDALNILKALCDTSTVRKVSYRKEAHQLKSEDIPQEFEYKGSMIFISNVDFQKFIDAGKNKYATHMSALMSRSLYLDLMIHERQELGVWINHIATSAKMFDIDGVPMSERKKVLAFMKKHREDFRELSIRTLKKINGLVKTNPTKWQSMAKVLLLRSN